MLQIVSHEKTLLPMYVIIKGMVQCEISDRFKRLL